MYLNELVSTPYVIAHRWACGSFNSKSTLYDENVSYLWEIVDIRTEII